MKKNVASLNCVLIFTSLLLIFGCSKIKTPVKVSSPDNNYIFTIHNEENLSYSLNYKNNALINKSSMGFELTDGSVIPGDIKIRKIVRDNKNETWKPVYGEKRSYKNSYNEILIQLNPLTGFDRDIDIRVRAFNEGVAFRYELKNCEDIKIANELTEFTFAEEPYVWASSHAQSLINKYKLSELPFIAERPLLAEFSDSLFVAIGEAGLVDFARMKFKKVSAANPTLKAYLETEQNDRDNEKITDSVNIPADGYNTPWRFIMAGGSPSEILQNNFLLLNLNEENKIANSSFIKPGKVIREVTLSTQGGIACVDFAKKHNLQFVEFDAGWYGHEYDEISDATTITVDTKRSPGPLDLHHVIDYARGKGIGIILYVNRRALEKQLDEILPLYKSWGVEGLKYGFVNVGPQKWTSWLHDAVKKAANHGLMVDIHDEYRPTGYSRTYPNLMTQEGVRGDETSGPNDMVINTIFTRMIAGAGDQTNCYFAERVDKVMGSHASQMAKTICIYSPWQFLFWYDRPADSPGKKGGAGATQGRIPEIQDLKFFEQVPTVWDDTRIIDGYPGELAVVARKNGDKWYLGAITGTKAHDLNIKPDFLDKGKKYKATVFSDDVSLNTITNVKITEIEVTNKSILNQHIKKQNGLAVIFDPVP